MTTPQVWVSATAQDIDYDGETPGSHWKLVGGIDTVQESDFFTYIQVLIGGHRTVKGSPAFLPRRRPPRQRMGSAVQQPATVLGRDRSLG